VTAALGAVRVLCPWPVPLTVELHDEGLRIAQRYRYSLYDASIVAAALSAGCGTLYSEDLQGGQLIDGRLTIRNPFALEG